MVNEFFLEGIIQKIPNLIHYENNFLCVVIQEISTLMEKSSLDLHRFNSGEIKEEDETSIGKIIQCQTIKGVPLTTIGVPCQGMEETTDRHRIINPNITMAHHRRFLHSRTLANSHQI
jgi:hypothetical protein